MAKTNTRRVALLIETSNEYARGLLRGIRSFVREHRPWSIYVGEQSRGESAPTWLKSWHGDGIIARIENNRIAEAVVAADVPTVDVSAARLVPGVPYVETDDRAIANMAAEHLLERGFRHFGFCGDPQFMWSNNRAEHFAARVRDAGFDCDILQIGSRGRGGLVWEKQQQAIAAWVRRLPKPVGVMACYDIRGRQVLDACRHAGVSVPDDVAVIGVDNDELVCDLADPPMTSVAADTHRTGYEAAQLLDRIMAGRKVAAQAHLFAPLGIVTRGSTDVLAIEDDDVSAAVRFIREHACDGINVADVLEQLPLSRRVFESRFKQLLGRTPHEEILRQQVARVKELLTQTDQPLRAVARLAGFKHVEYMSVAFKRGTGLPPSEYRRNAAGN